MSKKLERKNISISEAVHKRLKRHCARTGTKVQEVAALAITAYLRAQGRK